MSCRFTFSFSAQFYLHCVHQMHKKSRSTITLGLKLFISLTLSFTHLVSRRVHSTQKYSPIPTSTFPHLSITKQYLLPTHKNKPQVHNYFLITPIHSCGPYYLVYNHKSVLNTYISVNFIKISFRFWKKIIITTILSMFKFQGLFSKKVC